MFERKLAFLRPFSLATALLLLAMMSLGASPRLGFLAPAHAVNAPNGTGAFKPLVDWVEWNDFTATRNSSLINRRLVTSKTSTSQVGNGEISTWCELEPTSVNGGIQSYKSANRVTGYSGDGFAVLYRNNSVFNQNTLQNAITNSTLDRTVTFDIDCFSTFTEQPGATPIAIPLEGLVVADAESSNLSQNEYIEVTPETADVEWRILERYRVQNCFTDINATLNSAQKLRLQSDAEQCSMRVPGGQGNGPTAIAFMNGSTSATIEMRGGGRSAVALGVVLSADFGDAPIGVAVDGYQANFGEAGALISTTWNGTVLPAPTRPGTTTSTKVFRDLPRVDGGTTANYAQLATTETSSGQIRLGAGITTETSYPVTTNSPNQPATTDSDDALDSPLTPVPFLHSNTGTYSLPEIACVGEGAPSAGWIDFDLSGTFDTTPEQNEQSRPTTCVNGKTTLTWDVPAVNYENTADSFYARIRIAGRNDLINQNDTLRPIGLTTQGEVEDYRLPRQRPVMSIDKSATLVDSTTVKTGTHINYTIELQNVGNASFNPSHKASITDVIGEVLTYADVTESTITQDSGITTLDLQQQKILWNSGNDVIAPGAKVAINYTATVTSKPAGSSGIFTNTAWVNNHVTQKTNKWETNDAGQQIPELCAPSQPIIGASGHQICDAVQLAVTDLQVSKELREAESGTAIAQGDILSAGTYHYWVRFENHGGTTETINYVDDYSDVVDDTSEPTLEQTWHKKIGAEATEPSQWPDVKPQTVTVSQQSNTYQFSGTLKPQEALYVSYAIEVPAGGKLGGDGTLINRVKSADPDNCELGLCVTTEHITLKNSTITVHKQLNNVYGTPITTPDSEHLSGWEVTLTDAATDGKDKNTETRITDSDGVIDPFTIAHADQNGRAITLAETPLQGVDRGYHFESLICRITATDGQESAPLEVLPQTQLAVLPGEQIDCVLTNQQNPGTLTWQKVDADNTDLYLRGSEWEMALPNGTTVTVTDCISAQECGAAEQQPDNTLDAPDQTQSLQYPTSFRDTNPEPGQITISNMLWGTYTLTEQQAPLGYQLDQNSTYTARISDETLTVDLGQITNQKRTGLVVPLTGGIGQDHYIVAGIGIVAAAAAFMALRWLRRPRGVSNAA